MKIINVDGVEFYLDDGDEVVGVIGEGVFYPVFAVEDIFYPGIIIDELFYPGLLVEDVFYPTSEIILKKEDG